MPSDLFYLPPANPVSVVDSPAGVVGKAGQDLNRVPACGKSFGERQPLEGWFGLEPLSQHENPQVSPSLRLTPDERFT